MFRSAAEVFGRGADDVFLVGSNGVSFSWDGSALSQAETGIGVAEATDGTFYFTQVFLRPPPPGCRPRGGRARPGG